LWFEEAGRIEIVDYKTDSVPAAEAPSRAGVRATASDLWRWPRTADGPRTPSRPGWHFLRADALVEVDLAPSLLDSPEQVVRNSRKRRRRMEFPLREASIAAAARTSRASVRPHKCGQTIASCLPCRSTLQSLHTTKPDRQHILIEG